MPLEIKIKDRISKVEVLEQKGSLYHVKIDDREYLFDVTKVEEGVYSVIYNGHSTNMEMIEGDKPNQYIVNTRSNEYSVEVFDARARYLLANKEDLNSEENVISSPMPGKIVKIMVKGGDVVEKGDTLIVVSAMKMESEYKSPMKGTVVNVFVKEEDTVNGHQPLIELKPIVEPS
jgi:biotin carboxyl carrier protein